MKPGTPSTTEKAEARPGLVPGCAATIRESLANLPDSPGCYVFRDQAGEPLYVGKADVLRNRVRSYFQEQSPHSPRVSMLVGKIASVEVMVTRSTSEALLLESNLIKRLRPPFNVRMRDDKQYPYICLLMNEPFPRPVVVRRVQRDGNLYFGPYTSSWAMRQTLRLLKTVFQLRSCTREIRPGDRQQVCLEHHLGFCSAPCAGLVGIEEYGRQVKDVAEFLAGRGRETLARLEAAMRGAADALQFETAARIRDQVVAVRRVLERQRVVSTDLHDLDLAAVTSNDLQTAGAIVQVREGRVQGQQQFLLENADPEDAVGSMSQFLREYYLGGTQHGEVPPLLLLNSPCSDPEALEQCLSALRRGSGRRGGVRLRVPVRGEGRKLVELAASNARLFLEDQKQKLMADEARAEDALLCLQDALGLATPPYRIECYDISNTQGVETVGAMVVFENGLPRKSDYRRFKIRSVAGPDDFSSIQEVLRRRLARDPAGDDRFGALPDLIVIDGGKGQLHAALNVEREAAVEIPTVGLAKRLEEVFLPGAGEPLLLARDSPALLLLQRLRDEAHRFGLAYHRRRRGARSLRSILEDAPGMGPRRRMSVLKHLGSLDKIKQASVEELAGAPGMNRPVAQALYDYLHRSEADG